MSPYVYEFAKVAIAHLFAVVSPGPDFAMVLRQSLAYGRRTAIWTSIGIGSAILLHVTYSLLGIGLLVKNSELAFMMLKYAGATYLAWIGLQSVLARPREPTVEMGARPLSGPNRRAAWTAGFLTNALNPKAALFFVALFSVAVSPHASKLMQASYGIWMMAATMAWFSLVSLVFTQDSVRRQFLRYGHWINRALGVVFLAFAVSLAFTSMR